MHLNPISASFPSLAQHDRTCQVETSDTNNEKIEVGNVLAVNDKGKFRLAKTNDVGERPLYMALQKYGDLQAHMAGFFGVHDRTKDTKSVVTPGTEGEARADILNFSKGPAITGISLDGREVWETDMFEEGKVYAEGVKLTVNDEGRWTPVEGNGPFLAYCRGADYSRYSNDKVAVEGLMTGQMIRVIRFEVA